MRNISVLAENTNNSLWRHIKWPANLSPYVILLSANKETTQGINKVRGLFARMVWLFYV